MQTVQTEQNVSISIRPRFVGYTLTAIAFFFAAFSFLNQLFAAYKRSESDVVTVMSVDGENKLPAYFSTLLLLFAALLLAIIFMSKRKMAAPFRIHWLVLSAIFFFLSLDEAVALHEQLIGVTQRLVGSTTGIFMLAWVVPASLLLVVFVLAYVRFLWHLPPLTRWAFVVSGIVYVSGAVGMEIIGGYYLQRYGWDVTMWFLLSVEELLEMLGATAFIVTLLHYLGRQSTFFMIRFQTPNETSHTSEPTAVAQPKRSTHLVGKEF